MYYLKVVFGLGYPTPFQIKSRSRVSFSEIHRAHQQQIAFLISAIRSLTLTRNVWNCYWRLRCAFALTTAQVEK
jgi:hypothetical protein